MNTPVPLLLASPREPSGGSWLINCLLELGIRVNFKPTVDRVWPSVKNPRAPSAMWEPASGGGWRLHPRAEALKKWLPILDRQEALTFREDIEALYVQELPRPEFTGAHTILFIRDPRDAIQSLYRRVQPEMSLSEFIHLPHPETLLDAIAHWRLFVESWLAREDALVYRFEDYKADAEALLTRVAQDLDLDASPEALARAASESSYEKARAAENRYRATHIGDAEVAMRAGQVGEWKNAPELRDLGAIIEQRAGPVLTRLGYSLQVDAETRCTSDWVSPLRFLSAFDRIELPLGLRETAAVADPMTCPRMPDLLRFASTVDADTIRRARMQAREGRVLLDSLQEYAATWQIHQQQRMETARSACDEGAAYHMSRIRELMASRRTTREEAEPHPPLLHPLDALYADRPQALPHAQEISATQMPARYRELLAHHRDMTPTLEDHHLGRIRLETLRTARDGSLYSREVVLRLVDSELAAEYGAIRIHLDQIPDALHATILAAEVPLGTILHEHCVPHYCEPARFLQLEAGEALQELLGLHGPATLYARQNIVRNAQGETMYEVMEVLPP